MGLSGRIFGYSSASLLIPQALMGVAAVALLYAAVTRISGRAAGLVAGAALAVTPVAAMMFRFDNPDASMVLLMTAAAYCTVRALPRASVRWLALAGVALGFAFLAKMLEGLMVLPALGAVYLFAGAGGWVRRVRDLLIAAVALVVSAGWYVVLTMVWPASSRPYLAGSDDNSFMNLVFGYNGLDRIEGGGHRNPAAGAPTGALAHRFSGMFGNPPGPGRLFGGEFGGEISFLLPTALIALLVVVILRGRAARTDQVRAGAVMFGLWLLVDEIVLSFMGGTVHPYYSMAIAPPIAGLVGIGVVEAWRARDDAAAYRRWVARGGLAAMIVAGAIWAFVVLDREPTWQPWLRWAVLIVGSVAALGVLVPRRWSRRIGLGVVVAGVVAVLAAPAAYAITGDGVAHTGGSPSVLPQAHSGAGHGATAGMHSGTWGSTQDSPALDRLLAANHDRWAAAVNRTGTAASLELQARVPIMGIGGFSHDPAPTLVQFERDVADHEIGYYVMSGNGTGNAATTNAATPRHGRTGHETRSVRHASSGIGSGLGSRTRGGVSDEIDEWVMAHYTPRTVGNYVVYELDSSN